MEQGVLFPRIFQRGRNTLNEIGTFCKDYGQRILITGGKQALAAAEAKITSSIHAAGLTVTGVHWYGGECTWENAERLIQLIQATQTEVVIAVGGGRAIDTAKAAASKLGHLPVITVPTIAATCAAMTPLSIINNEQGEYMENYNESTCPVGVFVDLDIIAQAPGRWLYAGLGDTLAKLYEYRTTSQGVEKTGRVIGAIHSSHACYDIIKAYGKGAREAVLSQTVTPALAYSVDAIIYYGGMCSILGGVNLRGAAAHCVYFGFTYIPEAHQWGHGLLVGFGNLCLLAMEERPDAELIEEIKLAIDCGVPVTLKQIAKVNDADLQKVAQVACASSDMKNMPFTVTEQMVVLAIKRVDALATKLLGE